MIEGLLDGMCYWRLITRRVAGASNDIRKMAGEGTIPRDDLGTRREDPLAVTLVDDEDILELIILKNYEKQQTRSVA